MPGALWAAAATERIDPSSWLVLATGLVAALAVVVDGVWRWTRGVVTIAHEAGHAVAALATGRRLTGIRLHSDTSGLTLSRGRPRGPGMVLMLLAGHVGPAVLGLAAAALVARGRAVLLLWALLAALALMLLLIRNLFGLWVVLVGGVGVAAVSWWASPPAQSAVACALALFWLLAAPRTVLELAASRRRDRTSDADQLAGITHVPAAAWVLLLLALTVAAAVVGGRLLLGAAAGG